MEWVEGKGDRNMDLGHVDTKLFLKISFRRVLLHLKVRGLAQILASQQANQLQ